MEVEQQTLKATSGKKYQKQSWSEAKKRSDGVQKLETSTSERQKSAKKGNEKYDKSKVRCYCCKKFRHFAVDYWWYIDTGCSKHLTGNKKWLVDFDSRKRIKIICADDKYLNDEGMGNVRVVLNNGKRTLIQNMWYVLGMKSNLMIVCQLVEKGFSVTMKDNILNLYDCNQKLIMKSEQGRNRIFNVNVKTANSECLSTTSVIKESEI
ncbi:uncharacterized protein LOC127078936 [Lathyrus oleraceus]|uniref:uncharacterized protein LOC127078936 n=1 Tax=Pisum sativum TaxID=3888 RepID=UPI0021D14227|nr:uncharacterized protein LOC127078936 [Pisum sativum]